MKNKQPWYARWWVWLVIIVTATVLVATPFIINYAYMKGTTDGKPNTSFTANDMLGFYGSLLAFLGTVALGALALWQNYSFKRENKIKEQFAIRPYLFSVVEDLHIDYLTENKVEYINIEVLQEQTFRIIDARRNNPPDVVDYTVAKRAYLDFIEKPETYKLANIVERTTLLTNEVNHLVALNGKYILCEYCIENHGAGSAVKINLLINQEHAVPLFCLSKDEKKQLYLLCNAVKLSPGQDVALNISIEYYNMEDYGPYIQHEKITISRFQNGSLGLALNEQISEPVLGTKVTTE